MCWTARPVVRCVARSSGTRGSISATAASFDAPFSLSWRVIQRQKQHTRSAAQCAPSTRAAGISGTDNEQTKRKQGSARATTRDDARERRILIKENGGYSRQVGSIARRARAHLHERTSTTEEQSGSPRRLQDAQSTQRPARRTTSLPLSGRGVWFSQYARPTRHWPLFAFATARLGVAFVPGRNLPNLELTTRSGLRSGVFVLRKGVWRAAAKGQGPSPRYQVSSGFGSLIQIWNIPDLDP
jgi:hypothetical protein